MTLSTSRGLVGLVLNGYETSISNHQQTEGIHTVIEAQTIRILFPIKVVIFSSAIGVVELRPTLRVWLIARATFIAPSQLPLTAY